MFRLTGGAINGKHSKPGALSCLCRPAGRFDVIKSFTFPVARLLLINISLNDRRGAYARSHKTWLRHWKIQLPLEKQPLKKRNEHLFRKTVCWNVGKCSNCSSSRIRDLNTSKAKLRGAKDQREKAKPGWRRDGSLDRAATPQSYSYQKCTRLI